MKIRADREREREIVRRTLVGVVPGRALPREDALARRREEELRAGAVLCAASEARAVSLDELEHDGERERSETHQVMAPPWSQVSMVESHARHTPSALLPYHDLGQCMSHVPLGVRRYWSFFLFLPLRATGEKEGQARALLEKVREPRRIRTVRSRRRGTCRTRRWRRTSRRGELWKKGVSFVEKQKEEGEDALAWSA